MNIMTKTPSNSPLMGRIDTLVHEICPEGVEKVPFLKCATLTRGITYNKTQEANQGQDSYKVLRANNITFGLNCLNFDDVKEVVKEVRIKPEQWLKKDDILICAGSGSKEHVGKVAYIYQDIDYCFGGFMGVIRPKNGVLNRYLFHCLIGNTFSEYLNSALNSTTINNLNNQVMSGYEIPLPPLSIQQEIVSVLDSFTTLIDKMKQEVEKRKKQMEYYCDQYYGGDIEGMMAMANDSHNSVITFSELGTITRGKRFVRDDVRESGQPCIHYGDMYTYYGTKSYQANTFLDRDFPKKMRYAKKGDVVIVGAGENDYDIGVGVVWMGDEPAAVHDACYILEHSQNSMYISYYLRSNIYHQQLKKYVSSGKISSFSADGLGKVYIPIQPMGKQQEIVSTLDKFESYISKLEKMIALRQKQYEYYREQLLTFE